ncbi:MAG: FtsW/RodA/SpoVE family cell cycle protein [Bacteroidales bacterium]|nr:FtsW/RodA/SpoVE family cell cycle protein [Bacteroidales bacterium]
MGNTECNRDKASKKGLWNLIDDIEGDKVVWIIVLLLILISILAIFSSTPLLPSDSRLNVMKDHGITAFLGLMLIIGLYNIKKIGVFRVLSQFGFLLSFTLLLILDLHLNLGIIKAQRINDAWRTLGLLGFQIHVFEVVKVAMVMYLAWATNSYTIDQKAAAKKEESPTFMLANMLAKHPHTSFMGKPLAKRLLYIYGPALLICAMVAPGSNSSAIFIAAILVVTILIGNMPWKEIALACMVLAAMAASMAGLHKMTDGKFIPRLETLFSRMEAEYSTEILDGIKPGSKEFYETVDKIRQPYGAKLAVHEGGLLGKGSGNSTQKYCVTHIYSDFMFSFLVEEYGLVGGLLIIILYVSLLARSSIIARLCGNRFAKTAVGGLAVLITGQAFMHIAVNVDLTPMTGQTLPLISDGASAFLMSCTAFGTILSISRMAKKKIQSVEDKAGCDMDSIAENIAKAENSAIRAEQAKTWDTEK